MVIEIPIGGEVRKIKWDGRQFMPMRKNREDPLAYCTHFGNAVTYLVKDVANTDQVIDKKTKEDTLTLIQFVNRFEMILTELKNLKPEDFNMANAELQPDEADPADVNSVKKWIEEAVVEEDDDDLDGL